MPPLDDFKPDGNGIGVIVLGHGSRAPEALEVLNWVAAGMAERLQMPVLPASLQFNEPTLEECCRQMAAAGASRIIVAPYFLFTGNHMKIDIPEILDQLRRELPDTEFVLADALGEDELLVEVLARRTLAKAGEPALAGDGEQTENGGGGAQQAAVSGGAKPAAGGGGELSENEIAADLFAAFCDTACGPGDRSCVGEEDTGGKGERNSSDGKTAPGEPPAELARHPIEVESFEIIDSLLEPDDAADPQYQVIRRVVHTTGDPSLARAMYFSPGTIGAGVEAITAGASIYCDVNMVAAGIQPTATIRGIEVTCLVADPAVAELAVGKGITRGAAAMQLATPMLNGAIVAIGNSPTALFELLQLVDEQGLRPALVVGVPVGFVGAAESKEALAASVIPCITLPGNRGGSNIAAAIVNALIRLAAQGRI